MYVQGEYMYVKGECVCVKGECMCVKGEYMYVRGECVCVRGPEQIMSCTAPHTHTHRHALLCCIYSSLNACSSCRLRYHRISDTSSLVFTQLEFSLPLSYITSFTLLLTAPNDAAGASSVSSTLTCCCPGHSTLCL